MFTPIIRGPHQPIAYTATRLDHVHDSLVESVRKAVAENLMAGEHCEAPPRSFTFAISPKQPSTLGF
jgi:hypothetical protein